MTEKRVTYQAGKWKRYRLSCDRLIVDDRTKEWTLMSGSLRVAMPESLIAELVEVYLERDAKRRNDDERERASNDD